MKEVIEIRKIALADNNKLAKIIRDSLTEFKANKPGTVYYDESTDYLFESFNISHAVYFVLLINDNLCGGAGIFPTKDLPADTCELVKMYLTPNARGKGMGKILLENCIAEAKNEGYKKIYLETMPELTSAVPMYEKFGFYYLHHPLGNSGHNGCSLWMLKEI